MRTLALVIILPFLSASTFARVVRRQDAKPLSTWMADSVMARGQGACRDSSGGRSIGYEQGEFHQALRVLYAHTRDQKYKDYIKYGLDYAIAPDGSLPPSYEQWRYSLDDLRTGNSFIHFWLETGDERWLAPTKVYRQHLNDQPRNTEGGFSHRNATYPYQMWLDGLYMAQPFYALLAGAIEHNNQTAYKDIELQFKLVYENTFDPATKLLKHGYFDINAPAAITRPVWVDPVTGQCPHVWDRALGWYMMVIADLLAGPDKIPRNTSLFRTLLAQWRQLVPAVVSHADPATGAWWLIMDQPGREGNYIESSGSIMFIYSILRGVSSGLIPDHKGVYKKAAIKAYDWIVDNKLFENADGTLSLNGTVNVGSLGSNGTFEYYISQFIRVDDLKGTAAFVIASVEYEKLKMWH